MFVELCLQIFYIWYIWINRIWHWKTYKGRYAIKLNQTIQMKDNLSIALCAIPLDLLTSLFVDGLLLSRHVKLFTNFRAIEFVYDSNLFKTYEFCLICICGEANASCCLCYIIKKWFFNINHFSLIILYHSVCGGARGVVVIVVENGHGDTSSNPGRDWLHFTSH